MPASPLASFAPALARRVLRQMIGAARGGLKRITHEHVEALLRFVAEAQSGRRLALPGAMARKEFDWLVIGPEAVPAASPGYSYPVEVPGVVNVPELKTAIRFKIVDAGETPKSYNEARSVWRLDGSKVGAPLVLRNWRAGDRFQPLGTQRPLKLKELFRRRKIPAPQRPFWPVLERGGEILWVRGFPPANSAAVDAETRAVLVIDESPPS